MSDLFARLARARPGRPRPAGSGDVRRLEQRREQVEAALAAAGFARGPRRLRAAAPPAEPASARLRRALLELGGAFPAFGLYLATRPDLLPAHDCRELARIPDSAPPLAPAEVAERLRRELGRPSGELLAVLAPEPFASRRLFQLHRGRLHDGREVTLKLARTELPAAWAEDLTLLPLAAAVLADPEASERPERAERLGRALAVAGAGFAADLAARLDLAREAAHMEAVAADLGGAGFELLVAPRPCSELCGPGLLAVERLAGATLAETEVPAAERRDLARRLCLAWLRQALLGTRLPTELSAEEVLLLPDRQLAFLGGLAPGLPASSQVVLWDYLLATVAQDPDRACSLLLAELKGTEVDPAAPEPEPLTEEEIDLRARLRQVVPFRDGSWRDGGVDGLAEHLFVHWRLAVERGFTAAPHLVAFYRGLCAVAALARGVWPEGDALREGLQDLRVSLGMLETRRALAARELTRTLGRYAGMLLDFPQRLDAALDRAAGEAPPLRVAAPVRRRRGRSAAGPRTALLALAMGSLAALLYYLAGQGALAPWGERLGAGALLALALLLVRAAQRAA